MEPAALITKFYTAFAEGDAEAMAACYADEVQFEDPGFGRLEGPEVMAMWRMLLERSRGQLQLTLEKAEGKGAAGKAIWVARYPFGPKNRMVVNIVNAQFTLREGKIYQHHDEFPFWRWSRQALGLPGLLLGWTPFLRKKVQQQTRAMLHRYMKKHAGE